MRVDEWISGLTSLPPEFSYRSDEAGMLQWVTRDVMIHLEWWYSRFSCIYHHCLDTRCFCDADLSYIDCDIQDLKTYFLNKTLKQLFLSMEESYENSN